MQQRPLFLAFICALLLPSCGDGAEAQRTNATVRPDASRLTGCVTNLGYTVTPTLARAALQDVQFTVKGEVHGAWRIFDALLLPIAHAHPGHYAGGEVTGELTGPLIATWLPSATTLGVATLLDGRYHGANVTFRRASASQDPELPSDDPLLGHAYYLEGTAARDGVTVSFAAQIHLDDGAQMVGAPMDLVVAAPVTYDLGLVLASVDDGGVTLFDDIDFAALRGATDDTLRITPGSVAHNLLRRALVRHAFYAVSHP